MPQINRRTFLKASGGAATFGALSGCIGGIGGGGDSGPITIGALEPLSGPFAPWANVHSPGVQFAAAEVNEDGGVLGRDLEVVVADSGSDPAQGDSEFRRLVEQEGAVATTGAVSSDVGIRYSNTAGDLEVPHFLHMSGSNKVIRPNTDYIFRVGLVPSVRYMQAQASAFADAGYTKIGAIVADYAWGHAAGDAIKEYFEADVNVQVAPIGASDFKSYLRKFPKDLEMLITSGHPPGTVTMANQAFEIGYSPEVVTGSSAPPQLVADALSDAAIENFLHIHNSDPYTQEFADVAKRFADANDAQFNTHTAYGYATGKMIAAAIEDAGEADPTAIADAVRNIQFDTLYPEPIQYTEHGELDQTVVIYSYVRKEAPSYYSAGSYSYEERSRSEPVPALPADQ